MGMRRGAVGLLVSALLRSGLVFEGAKGETRRGRRPTRLYVETRRRCTLAVDVGASRTSLLVTDLLGAPLSEVLDFPTPGRPGALVSQVLRRARRLLRAQPPLVACAGIGIVLSGLVDLAAGRLSYSPTLGWRDVDLQASLHAATGIPVLVENSCKACVLAQVWAVQGDPPVDGPVAFVNVSDGVGVGIAIDGKLLRGSHNIAGEFGHVSLDAEGPLCCCGQRGCWEAYVSNRATVARYARCDPSWAASAAAAPLTVEDIVARARAGDEHALATLRETAVYLAKGFATIVKAVDPGRIYLAGDLTSAWEILAPTLRSTLRAETFLRSGGETEILIVPLGEHPACAGPRLSSLPWPSPPLSPERSRPPDAAHLALSGASIASPVTT